jgi:hypothetical protein
MRWRERHWRTVLLVGAALAILPSCLWPYSLTGGFGSSDHSPWRHLCCESCSVRFPSVNSAKLNSKSCSLSGMGLRPTEIHENPLERRQVWVLWGTARNGEVIAAVRQLRSSVCLIRSVRAYR